MAVVTKSLNTDAMVGMITLIIGTMQVVGIPTNAGKMMEELLSVVRILVEDTIILEPILAGVILFICTGNAIPIAQHVLPLAVVIAVQVAILPTTNGKGPIDAVKPIVQVEELDMGQVEGNMLQLIIHVDIAINIAVGARLVELLLLASHAHPVII